MIELNDNRWKYFHGGYRSPYDASIPLRRLVNASANETEEILDELINELHHQGDVGLASYYALPHLLRIATERHLKSFKIFLLVSVIEIQRHKEGNPPLPKEEEASYLQSIRHYVPELVTQSISDPWDLTFTITVLSALAIAKQQVQVGEALSYLDDKDIIARFLANPTNDDDVGTAKEPSIKEWWAKRRWKYNKGLIIAGISAFILYAILGSILIAPHDHEFEITLFTIGFQGIGYLSMMFVANIFYFLGPIADRLWNKDNEDIFRIRLFHFGYWFSFALPFSIPIAVVYIYLTHQN